jgi:Uma2 family endonuclease
MATMTTLQRGRPFTRSELDALPDDGRRHELVDGTLIVTPAPSPRHQTVLGELFVTLHEACAADLQVLFAPLDVALAEDTVLEPDLLVAARSEFTARDLPTAPLLAVEVLSPSTRRLDLTLKRSVFEAAGCPSYWVVDPDRPSLTAWQLEEGRYVEVAHVSGAETFVATDPFAVTITPAALLG